MTVVLVLLGVGIILIACATIPNLRPSERGLLNGLGIAALLWALILGAILLFTN